MNVKFSFHESCVHSSCTLCEIKTKKRRGQQGATRSNTFADAGVRKRGVEPKRKGKLQFSLVLLAGLLSLVFSHRVSHGFLSSQHYFLLTNTFPA